MFDADPIYVCEECGHTWRSPEWPDCCENCGELSSMLRQYPPDALDHAEADSAQIIGEE